MLCNPPRIAYVQCGASVVANAKFCNECGASLKAPSCPKCHTAVQPGAKFCIECGTALS